jgi:hypothetical protein
MAVKENYQRDSITRLKKGNMPILTDLDPGLIFALFKGEPGTRKSTAALSFPLPQFWFSFDKKMQSIIIPARNWNINKDLIEFEDYNDWTNARAKLERFQINPQLSNGRPIKTIIIDSMTSMGDTVNQQTLLTKRGTKTKDNQNAGKVIGGIAINTIEDYNAEMAAFQELVALLTDIHKKYSIHIVLIAHVLQTEYKSIDGETHMSRTLVTGGKKAAAKVPAYFSEVYHFQVKKDLSGGGTYEALTVHTGDDFARTALPLPKTLEIGNDPLYSKYIEPAIKKLKEGGIF